VYNKDGSLAPGMYPTVDWSMSAGENPLFVSTTSVVTTTERTFVIASVNGRAHGIDVRKGLLRKTGWAHQLDVASFADV
jgi:membrane fusion protein (multidrug efflux system)